MPMAEYERECGTDANCWRAYRFYISGLVFSPNGRQLACIDSHNRFTLWDRGEKGATLEWPIGKSPIFPQIHTGKYQMLFLPDGSLVFADPSGGAVKHLFGSTVFVNRHAPFAVGTGRKDTANDLGEADTDYVRYNGGYLIKVDFPW